MILKELLRPDPYKKEAGICYEKQEEALNRRVKEIENYSIQEDRKNKFILRNKMKIKRVSLKKATAFFNSAAGYLNAGHKEKALTLADKASMHALFKEKVSELKKKIQK